MKKLLITLALSTSSFAQSFYRVGPKAMSPECETAKNRVIYLLNELPNVINEKVYIVCDRKTWDNATANFRLAGHLDPLSGFSYPELKESYYFFKDVLDERPSTRTRGFGLGEFVIAHELAHLICQCDNENLADSNAANLLKAYHSHRQPK